MRHRTPLHAARTALLSHLECRVSRGSNAMNNHLLNPGLPVLDDTEIILQEIRTEWVFLKNEQLLV